MTRLERALGALTLALCVAGASALTPADADAQGKGRKLGHQKEKHADVRRSGDDDHDRDRRRDRDRDDDRDDDRRADRRRYEARDGRGVRYGAVPRGHLPRPGLCRIWIAGVPPGRQPAATDCATAERNRPANARVLYGANTRRGRDARDDGRYDSRRDTRRDDRVDPRDERRSPYPLPAPPRRPVSVPFP